MMRAGYRWFRCFSAGLGGHEIAETIFLFAQFAELMARTENCELCEQNDTTPRSFGCLAYSTLRFTR
jgi:hypothetical protein